MKKNAWLLAGVLAFAASSSWALKVTSGEVKYEQNNVWVTAKAGDQVPNGVAVSVVSDHAQLTEGDITVRVNSGDSFQVDKIGGGNGMMGALVPPSFKVTALPSASGGNSAVSVSRMGMTATLHSGDVVRTDEESVSPFQIVSGVVKVTQGSQTQTFSAGQAVPPLFPLSAPFLSAGVIGGINAGIATSPTQETTYSGSSPN